jgi:hypothetical protein
MTETIDQMIAEKIGQDTALPSLEVASETTIQVAACSGGSGGCYYSSTLSFRNATSPLPMEFNPRKVFMQLFGEGDTPAEREAIARQTRSILDLISSRTQELQRTLGASDRATLGEYLDTVREIERRVQKAEQRDLSAIELPEAPVGELDNFDDQVKLMFDLIALAYQADLTRVATFVMAAEGTDRNYPQFGDTDGFHPTSHHANQPGRIAALSKIQHYHMDRFAQFLKKLADTQEGAGSILDQSLFLYGSNMGNSNAHDNYPIPEVLIGGANGKHVGGKNLTLPERTPLANIHLTILDKLGIPQPSFGNSTGVISEI